MQNEENMKIKLGKYLGVMMLSMGGFLPAIAYHFDHLDMNDGLSNGYVTSMAQDYHGQIWIATVMGVNRLDGQRFTSFDTENSELPENYILNICPDKTGLLWMCTEKGKLCYYDNRTMKIVTPRWQDKLIKKSEFVKIVDAADGGLWFLRTSGNPIHYNIYTKKTEVLKLKTGDVIRGRKQSMLDDGVGRLWIGCSQLGGLCVVDKEKGTIAHYRHVKGDAESLPGDNVYVIFRDHFGNIWVGTNNGLALYNPANNNFISYVHEAKRASSILADHIYTILMTPDGRLWTGSDTGGVSILDLRSPEWRDPTSAVFQNITAGNDEQGLSSRNIHRLMLDSFGNIWVGNFSTGIDVIKHEESPFRLLDYLKEDSRGRSVSNHVWSICQDHNNNIWVGGENRISMFQDNIEKIHIDLTRYLTRSYAQVRSLFDDRKGSLWIGLFDDGLLQMNLMTKRISRVVMSKPNLDVNCISMDTDGRIWIGHEYGLISFMNGKIHTEPSLNSVISSTAVYGIQRDTKGRLWVATLLNGIFIFNRDGHLMEHKTVQHGLSDNKVFNLYLDRRGWMWACTDNGLDCFPNARDTYQMKQYNKMGGLGSNHTFGIQEDRHGSLWVSTMAGISSIDIQKGNIENYDDRYGIPQSSYVDCNVKSCLTTDGTVYFGLQNGICYFNPMSIKENAVLSPLHITDCRIMDTRNGKFNLLPKISFDNDPEIILNYNQNTFKIRFSVTDYAQRNASEYAYRMEGLGYSWTDIQDEDEITFRNLPPGHYTLYVKARLNGQSWDERHIAKMDIRISPPLWLAWYSELLYLFIIAAVIYSGVRFYLRKVRLEDTLKKEKEESRIRQQLNDERMNFYTNIAHELRTPLTLIIGPLEDIKDDVETSAKSKKKIKLIYDSALHLLTLINQLMEFRKTETRNRLLSVRRGNLSKLIADIASRYSELNNNPEVKFHTDIQDAEAVCLFDSEVITLIMNNLISNAIKYTSKGDIRISICRKMDEHDKERYEMTVTDTGYGIEARALPSIFDRYYQVKGRHQAPGTGIGLSLVKSLVTLHEGEITVESEVDKGTSFHVSISKDNAYPNALHDDTLSNTFGDEPTEKDDTCPHPSNKPTSTDEETKPILAVIEDNTDIRRYIAEALKDDYQIVEAADGVQGWDIIRQTVPDIIVSDIMMPLMDGIELCKRVKGDVTTSHIPVIMLTAKDTISNQEEGYNSGTDSYLTKPFSTKLLRSRVKNLLQQRHLMMLKYIDSAVNQKVAPLDFMPTKAQEETPLNKIDSKFLDKLTTMINDNIVNPELNVDFLADKMCMSHSAFYRKLKGMTGRSANEFIRMVRLHRAKEIIESGKQNVTEAAYMTGFGDIPYFRSCFKSEFGVNPSEIGQSTSK